MTTKRKFVSLFASFCLLLFSGWASAGAGDNNANARKIDVMTANLYLGADIFRVVGVPADQIPFVIAEVFGIVQATNFPERAEAIADAIMERQPHVIGLQEVSWYRTGAFDGIPNNAEDTAYDFLQLLMDALAARGLDYSVAGSVTNADVEAPMFDGNGLVDLRLTDRDVVLVRGDVQAGPAIAANYAENASFPLAGGEVEFLRGYVMMPVQVMGRSYLFVNTHLETRLESFAPLSLGRVYQSAQALELQGMVDFLNAAVFGSLPVIIVGDLNSDPNDQPVVVPPGTGIPLPVLVPPYQIMLGAGYTDTWSVRQGRTDTGETCCHNEFLNNPVEDFNERIDHIFFLDTEAELGPVQAEVINDDPAEKTASGLWPSDHGFVSSSLKQKNLKK